MTSVKHYIQHVTSNIRLRMHPTSNISSIKSAFQQFECFVESFRLAIGTFRIFLHQ